ncbi:MAG: PQQ-dependent sugar dehydrogenase, partial [Verrucomicrobiae bacterium]|nr:PQQ-dependent sugar dehydrogenase [Verrucomicrobiae bacterium]
MVVRWTVLFLLLFNVTGPVLSRAAAQRYIANPPVFPSVPPPSDYSLVNAFPGLRFPLATDLIVGMAVPPGRTNEIFLTGQLGRIFVITNLLAPTRTVFLDLSADTFAPIGGECGLVGLAFHPNYAQNRQFYVYYARTNRATEKMYITLSRFLTDPTNPYQVVPGSEQFLFQQHDRDFIHQGGDIQFGPDGYMYVPIGDEGAQNDPYKSSQRIDEGYFSGVLRIDVDGRPGSLVPNAHPNLGSGYWIPPDNPYIGATSFNGKAVDPTKVRTEFWAVGTRNPHRMTFDSATGQAYFGDVGGVLREEVNRLMKGANYGWAHYEGTLFNPNAHIGNPPANFNYTPPIYEYSRSAGNPNLRGSAVIGGLVYRGTKYPGLIGKYLF